MVRAALGALRFPFDESELGDVVYWREEYSTEDILKILVTEVICCKVLRTAKIPKLLLVEKVQVYIRLTLQVLLEFLPGRLEGIESQNELENFYTVFLLFRNYSVNF